jgi:Fanconi anemia group M protein
LTEAREDSLDREFPRFDKSLGNEWIYPSNYARRDYQFSIVQQALYKNTLASLPTGCDVTNFFSRFQ